MYWLRLTTSHSDRLALLPQYIGRPKVPQSDAALRGRFASSLSANVEAVMRLSDPARANAFKHYCVTMSRVFKQLARSLRQGAPAVFIVGHSSWNEIRLATSDLFSELAAPEFELQELLWYPIKNR